MKMDKKFAEALGWYGVLAILGSYALMSFGIIPSKGVIYQLLNLTGAAGIIAISLRKGVKQPVVLNAVWAAIAVAALIRLALA